MGIKVLTTLLDSRSLARVIGCVLVFGAVAPFAYVQSVVLRSGCVHSVLTVWLIRPDLLVGFGVVSSRSACVWLCNASFHTDW